MNTQELTKEQNIFKLYNSLNKSGARSEFIRQWSKEVKRSFNTVKNHWFTAREIPSEITEKQKEWAINYLININK